MTWIDANLGSKVTMKYPSVYLVGERAHGEVPLGGLRSERPAPDAARR